MSHPTNESERRSEWRPWSSNLTTARINLIGKGTIWWEPSCLECFVDRYSKSIMSTQIGCLGSNLLLNQDSLMSTHSYFTMEYYSKDMTWIDMNCLQPLVMTNSDWSCQMWAGLGFHCTSVWVMGVLGAALRMLQHLKSWSATLSLPTCTKWNTNIIGKDAELTLWADACGCTIKIHLRITVHCYIFICRDFDLL